MKTPIYDFVSAYVQRSPARFHMPGHKGRGPLGCEERDLTEVTGADVLSAPEGILLESENNATSLFGSAHTFYSTEGSSLCIRAMLSLVSAIAPEGKRKILAARNAHKTLLYAAALLDMEIVWLPTTKDATLSSSPVTPETVATALEANPDVIAVYLTSPDYRGVLADVREIARICHQKNRLLLVDNAHGAYLRFLTPSRHPLDLGADLVCDSAHKTLPVLTGGAYLHVAKGAPTALLPLVRQHLALFASTSPSYLILQSLDLCNRTLAKNFSEALADAVERTATTKKALAEMGYSPRSSEPLKLVLDTRAYGYTGEEFAAVLHGEGVEVEMAEPQGVVLMTAPGNSAQDFDTLLQVCRRIPRREALAQPDERIPPVETATSLRTAILSPAETVNVRAAVGRVCATPTVTCPPAIPIAISGERITEEHLRLFLAYGIEQIAVMKES